MPVIKIFNLPILYGLICVQSSFVTFLAIGLFDWNMGQKFYMERPGFKILARPFWNNTIVKMAREINLSLIALSVEKNIEFQV